MPRFRKRLPHGVETELLTLCRRRCCACFCLDGDGSAKTEGQIAHLNHNRSDNSLTNLAYLCLRHHAMYDAVAPQSKGLTAAEMRHYQNELYRHLGTATRESITAGVPRVKLAQISLSPQSVKDCEALNISAENVRSFIFEETTRHSVMLSCEFSSVPLVFGSLVLLVSWDLQDLRAERLLRRTEAYPLHDAWSECLSVYRRATLLPYRQPGPNRLLSNAHVRNSLAVMRQLSDAAERFLRAIETHGGERPSAFFTIRSLIDEAEAAFAADDRAAVVRLEVLLSTVHKLILEHAPQGEVTVGSPLPRSSSSPSAPVPRAVPASGTGSRPSVLLVDDELMFSQTMKEILTDVGFVVTCASSMNEAMRHIVETDFDVVITDMVMCAEHGGLLGASGREITAAVKKSSPRTKVIVMSGYAGMSEMADLFRAGVDLFISKTAYFADGPTEIAQRIRSVLGASAP